jgi:ubiquinone/menaquinone biosynthesis C-methylase UbiE
VSDSNQEVFDREADTYVDLALKPAERRAMALLADRLSSIEMLDLGVGTGRTGYTFAPLVSRYVGVDYSPRMLERARRLLGDGGVELVLGDARDLSGVEGSFDFVLFSFNGIDAVGHEDRLKILAEVRRILRPSGHFLFSSHSTGALPLDPRPERSPSLRGSRLYALYSQATTIRYGRRIRKINRKLDLRLAAERGWIIVSGRGQNFQVDDYYVDPEYQVQQLRNAGFEVDAIFDVAGRDVTLPHGGRDPWLDYFCRVPG